MDLGILEKHRNDRREYEGTRELGNQDGLVLGILEKHRNDRREHEGARDELGDS